MEKFKVLVWANEQDKALGKYATIVHGAFGGCDVPDLLTMDATIEKLKLIYDYLDFSLVKLITVKLFDMSTITKDEV